MISRELVNLERVAAAFRSAQRVNAFRALAREAEREDGALLPGPEVLEHLGVAGGEHELPVAMKLWSEA